jgi:hypothetical protein
VNPREEWLLRWLAGINEFDSELVAAIDTCAVAKMVHAGLLTVTREMVMMANAASHAQLSRHPGRALILARISTALAARLTAPLRDVLECSGDAWKHLTAALKECSQHEDALEAAERAEEAYAMLETVAVPGSVDVVRKQATLALIRGQSLHALGRSDEGLLQIEHAANYFIGYCDDRKAYATARIIYAYMLSSLGRREVAIGWLQDLAAHARADRDQETLAYVLNNLGLDYVHTRRLDEARPCFNTALAIFEQMGQHLEVQNVRVGLAFALIQEGRYNEAISEFYIVRKRFFELGTPVLAAEVALHIVETLFLAKRLDDIPALCREMMDTFTAARLPREVRKAIAFVSEAAQHRTLTNFQVTHARIFIEQAQESPSARFVASQ